MKQLTADNITTSSSSSRISSVNSKSSKNSERNKNVLKSVLKSAILSGNGTNLAQPSGKYRSIWYMEISEMPTGNFGRMESAPGLLQSARNSTGATQRFPANHKASSEQKNRGCGCFRTNHNRGKILLLVCEGLRECAPQRLFLWRNDIYFGQRRDKQTARETIICRLAAGNFEDETESMQICFTAWRLRSLNTKQTRHNTFCWMKDENVEEERDLTRKCFWMTETKRGTK